MSVIPCSTVYGTLILISETNLSSVPYGRMVLLFLRKIIDWCTKKVSQTSDDYVIKMINAICVTYNNNSAFINEVAPYLKNQKIFEVYNTKSMQLRSH